MHYFAYGSNLNRADLVRWSSERGVHLLSLVPVGPAFLPDRALAFTHRSTTRHGGVLDVPPARGRCVAGVIFELDDRERAALDRKEGDGHAYRRVEAVAITPGGGESRVTVYEVDPAHRRRFIAPHPDYLDVVRGGYRAFELDAAPLEAAARNEPHPGAIHRLFVYGTLRQGECRHPILVRHGADPLGEGRVDGTLFDLGAYPALRVTPRAQSVIGELYEVEDIGALIAELDVVEGFGGFDRPGSPYRRAVVSARNARESMLAWTYLFAGNADGVPVIPGGDWRRRQNVP